jgi:hypothetical protein
MARRLELLCLIAGLGLGGCSGQAQGEPAGAACQGPDGARIENGDGGVYYQAEHVPAGSTCVSEERVCSDGVLSGSYAHATCSVASPQDCVGPDGTLIADGASRVYYEAASVLEGESCVAEERACSAGVLSGSFTARACRVCVWADVGGCNCSPMACDACNGTQAQEDDCGHQRSVPCVVPASGCDGLCCNHACCAVDQVCDGDVCCSPSWHAVSTCNCRATIGSGCTGTLDLEDGCGGSDTQSCTLPTVGRVTAPYVAVSHADQQSNAGLMMDCPLFTFVDGSTRYWMAATNGPPSWIVRHTKAVGTLERPFITELWERDQATLFGNPTGAGGVWWIANVYQDPAGLLAFVHVEADGMYWNGTEWRGRGRMGLAWSTDMGEHFTYLGHVIIPYGDPDDMLLANVHGTPYVVHQGYFYIYYMDNGIFAIARAPVAEVLAAAQAGVTSTWRKRYNNQWTEPGLGGNRQSMPFGGIAHSDATYSTTTGKYYLILSWMSWSGADTYIKVYEADDPVTWYQPPRTIVLQTAGTVHTGYQYTTFVDGSGGDNGAAGDVFHLYSLKENGSTSINGAYRWTIDLGGGTFHRSAEEFSGTQGQAGWYYDAATGGNITQLSPMQWRAGELTWRPAGGADPLASWRAGGGHAGTSVDPVLRWVAPGAGHLEITGAVYDLDGACGDGIAADIHCNGATIWQTTLDNDDTVGAGHKIIRRVAAGDALLFRVGRRGTVDCDSFAWDPNVDYVNGVWLLSSGFSDHHTERWAYQYLEAGTYHDMTFSDGWWRGPEANLLIGGATLHPGATRDSAVRWTAPAAGRIRVSGTVSDNHAGCGDGIVASVRQQSGATLSTLAGPTTIADGGSQAIAVETPVAVGDRIYFVVNRRTTDSCDTTSWDPLVEYCGATCP